MRRRHGNRKGEVKSENDQENLDETGRGDGSAASRTSGGAPRPARYTEFRVAFLVLMGSAFLSAMWAPVSDCDETFNYWEPTHYAMFGRGLQTWEYSPEYALRPYLYVLVHSVVGQLVASSLFLASKVRLFFAMRLAMGALCALAETCLHQAVLEVYGARVATLLLLLLAASPGMFFASTAFLPSTTAMNLFMLAMAFWLRAAHAHYVTTDKRRTHQGEQGEHNETAGATRGTTASEAHTAVSMTQARYAMWAAVGAAVLSGWPFMAIAAAPLVLHCWAMHGLDRTVLWGLQAVAVCVGAQMVVDVAFYGVWTCSICNLIVYNTAGIISAITGAELTGGAALGPLLYGSEPWSFYFINLVLQFGAVVPLALVAMPLLALLEGVATRTRTAFPGIADADAGQKQHKQGRVVGGRALLIMSPLYVWLAFLTPQAHKEGMRPHRACLGRFFGSSACFVWVRQSEDAVFWARHDTEPHMQEYVRCPLVVSPHCFSP